MRLAESGSRLPAKRGADLGNVVTRRVSVREHSLDNCEYPTGPPLKSPTAMVCVPIAETAFETKIILLPDASIPDEFKAVEITFPICKKLQCPFDLI